MKAAFLAGLGGAICIASLSALSEVLAVPLLLAPFGASCVLVFGVPASPFARPRNVIGGYLASAMMGLASVALLGPGTAGMAIGVGLAIIAMMLTETIHPPAGAVPIVVGLTKPGLLFLGAPVLAGAVLIVLIGLAYRQMLAWPAARKIPPIAVPDQPDAPR